MSATTIRITTNAAASAVYNDQEAQAIALEILGKYATKVIVGGHKDSAVESFGTSAETCYHEVKNSRKLVFWKMLTYASIITLFASLLAPIVILVANFNSPLNVFESKVITAGITAAMSLFMVFFSLFKRGDVPHPFNTVGGTSKMIARRWKKDRQIAIDYGIVEGIAWKIKSASKSLAYPLGGAALSKGCTEVLIRILGNAIVDEAKKVLESKRDGIKSNADERKSVIVNFARKTIGLQTEEMSVYFDRAKTSLGIRN